MAHNDFPPFAPVLDTEAEAARLLLSQGERRRTGHLYSDCPGLDVAPAAKAGKAPGCKPCTARFQEVGQLARTHQQSYDAAWYAAQAQLTVEAPVAVAVGAFQAADEWVSVGTRTVGRGTGYEYTVARDEPVVDRFEAQAAPAKPARKPNKFGGRCGACNGYVEAGQGWLTGKPGSWGVMHANWEDGGCPAGTEDRGYDRGGDARDAEATEVGVYVRSDGRLVRVARSRSTGFLYALLCTLEEDGEDEYLKGRHNLRGLRKATLEEAVAYGLKTVRCCVCSTQLENPESKRLGIGPICRSKAF